MLGTQKHYLYEIKVLSQESFVNENSKMALPGLSSLSHPCHRDKWVNLTIFLWLVYLKILRSLAKMSLPHSSVRDLKKERSIVRLVPWSIHEPDPTQPA